MARDTIVKDGVAHYSLWLIFHRDGSARITRGQPDCDRNERAVALTVRLPVALFRTPTLSAVITVDDPATPGQQIDVKAAAEALRETLGCDVEIVIREPSE